MTTDYDHEGKALHRLTLTDHTVDVLLSVLGHTAQNSDNYECEIVARILCEATGRDVPEWADVANEAEAYLVQAESAGMIGENDWQPSTDRRYFLVNFGDGQGVVEYTAEAITEKLHPSAGFFNR